MNNKNANRYARRNPVGKTKEERVRQEQQASRIEPLVKIINNESGTFEVKGKNSEGKTEVTFWVMQESRHSNINSNNQGLGATITAIKEVLGIDTEYSVGSGKKQDKNMYKVSVALDKAQLEEFKKFQKENANKVRER